MVIAQIARTKDIARNAIAGPGMNRQKNRENVLSNKHILERPERRLADSRIQGRRIRRLRCTGGGSQAGH